MGEWRVPTDARNLVADLRCINPVKRQTQDVFPPTVVNTNTTLCVLSADQSDGIAKRSLSIRCRCRFTVYAELALDKDS